MRFCQGSTDSNGLFFAGLKQIECSQLMNSSFTGYQRRRWTHASPDDTATEVFKLNFVRFS